RRTRRGLSRRLRRGRGRAFGWRRRCRRLRLLDSESLPQLRDPPAHGLVLARDRLVLLERRECAIRVTQIEVLDDAKGPPRRRVARVGADRLLVGGGRVLELAAHALRDAEFRPGDGTAGLVRNGALQRVLRLIQMALLALQDGKVNQWRGKLGILQRDLL